jgi:hypothetical protein
MFRRERAQNFSATAWRKRGAFAIEQRDAKSRAGISAQKVHALDGDPLESGPAARGQPTAKQAETCEAVWDKPSAASNSRGLDCRHIGTD